MRGVGPEGQPAGDVCDEKDKRRRGGSGGVDYAEALGRENYNRGGHRWRCSPAAARRRGLVRVGVPLHGDGDGHERGLKRRDAHAAVAAHLEEDEVAALHGRVAVPHVLAGARLELAQRRLLLEVLRPVGLLGLRGRLRGDVRAGEEDVGVRGRGLQAVPRVEPGLRARARRRGRAVEALEHVLAEREPADGVGRVHHLAVDLHAVDLVLEDAALLVEVEVGHRVDVRGRPAAARRPARVPRHYNPLAAPVVAQPVGDLGAVDHDAAEEADHGEELLVGREAPRLHARRVRQLHVGRVDGVVRLAVGEVRHVGLEGVDGLAEVELELARGLAPVAGRRAERGELDKVVARAGQLHGRLLALALHDLVEVELLGDRRRVVGRQMGERRGARRRRSPGDARNRALVGLRRPVGRGDDRQGEQAGHGRTGDVHGR